MDALNIVKKEVLVETGTSVVWRGEEASTGNPLAVKEMLGHGQYERLRLLREYEILQRLNGIPGLPEPVALIDNEATLALVYQDKLGVLLRPTDTFDLAQVLSIGAEILDILRRVHRRGVVHRDICPLNFVIAPTQICLGNFHNAANLYADNQAAGGLHGDGSGTLAFMSPEQTGQTNLRVDHRTDLYSVGASLYALLAHQAPFPYKSNDRILQGVLSEEPRPLLALNPQVPTALVRIIEKLMHKDPSGRYQSARGAASDLRKCITMLEARGRIDDFTLNDDSAIDQLQLNDQLYGREQPMRHLLRAFQHIQQKRRHLCLITGPSGVGKSALVNTLADPVRRAGGWYGAGKYDQLRRHVPFSALRQVIDSYLRAMLLRGPAKVDDMRERVRTTLGASAEMLVEAVPALETLLGPQQAQPSIAPQELESRVLSMWARFLDVLSELQPFVMFLDDLQWADSGTLKLLQVLMLDTRPRAGMLIVASVRDGEGSAEDDLSTTLQRIFESGAACSRIHLSTLNAMDVEKLIMDWSHGRTARASELAAFVVAKTNGNPFFVRELLKHMWLKGIWHADDEDAERWTWDDAQVQSMRVSANVVSLLESRMRELPRVQQQTACLCACLGAQFTLQQFAEVSELTSEQAIRSLALLLDGGFLVESKSPSESGPLGNTRIRFSHDRMQQVAHGLCDDSMVTAFHEQISRTILARTREQPPAAWVTSAIDHFNHASQQLIPTIGVMKLAELNLAAAREYTRAMAYDVAMQYLQVGLNLLDETVPLRPGTLRWRIQMQMAHNQWMLRDARGAYLRLQQLLAAADSQMSRADVYRQLAEIGFTLTQMEQAVRDGLAGLACLGVNIPACPTDEDVQEQLQTALELAGNRSVAELVEAKPLTNEIQLRVLEVIASFTSPSFWVDRRLNYYLGCYSATMVLRGGNFNGSAFAYANFSCAIFDLTKNQSLASRIASAATEIVSKNEYSFKSGYALLLPAVFVSYVDMNAESMLELLRRCYRITHDTGDHASYTQVCNYLQHHALRTSLLTLEESCADFERAYERLPMAIGLLYTMRQTGACLRGATLDKDSLSDAVFDEERIIPHLYSKRLWHTYWSLRSLVAYVHGDIEKSHEYVVKNDESGVWPNVSGFDAHFSRFIAAIIYTEEAMESGRHEVSHPDFLRGHEGAFQFYTHLDSPFIGETTLIAAQTTAVAGDFVFADALYDAALTELDASDYRYAPAIGFECAARYHRRRGRHWAARSCAARSAAHYYAWGCTRKVAMMRSEWRLDAHIDDSLAMGIRPGGMQHGLQLEQLLPVMEAVAAAKNVPDLLMLAQNFVPTVCRADRIVLMSDHMGTSLQPMNDNDMLSSGLPTLPLELFAYTERSKATSLIADTSAVQEKDWDTYWRDAGVKSVLCVPITVRDRVRAIIYVENRVLPNAFSSQAVLALEALAAVAGTVYARKLIEENVESEVTRRFGSALEAGAKKSRQEAQNAEVRMAGGFAHEMRNALFGPQLLLESMGENEEQPGIFNELHTSMESVEKAASDEERFRAIGTLRECVETLSSAFDTVNASLARGLAVTNMIMDYAHLGHVAPIREPVPVMRVVGRLRDDLGSELQGLGIDLQTSIDPAFKVDMGEDHLYAIVRNLVANARDALREGNDTRARIIRVRTRQDRAKASLIVEDTGCGMPDHVRTRVFQPFFSTKGVDGNGLGLGMCRKLCEIYGGTLDFVSEEGIGTVFTLQIPSNS